MLPYIPYHEQDLFKDNIGHVPTDLTMVTGKVLPSKRRQMVIQHIIVMDGTSVSWFKFSFLILSVVVCKQNKTKTDVL